jgi:4a-hydroxytetrahydrobiopterin dehydratase
MNPRRLTATEVSDLAQTLPMWQVVDTYAIAINWVVAIAGAAESIDHHPDIDIRWRTLRIALITHSTGCLTELDLDLARLIDTVLSTGA